jgi:2,3-bisphosphoglycerate-independent phosphoglycerate mutase
MKKSPVALLIVDGLGLSKDKNHNAFYKANTPNIDKLMKNHSSLEASQESVGLPSNQMGNSEVGHLHIGAGKIIEQPIKKIAKNFYSEIKNNIFFNQKLSQCNKVHIIGIASNGGVHGHIDHILKLCDYIPKDKKIIIHAITDGRDTSPSTCQHFLDILKNSIPRNAFINTISGRYYALDRDENFIRTNLFCQALIRGEGEKISSLDKFTVIKDDDEFIKPTVVDENIFIDEKDIIICTNYRSDRAIQMYKTISNLTSKLNIEFFTFTRYLDSQINENILFNQKHLTKTLSSYISDMGLRQLKIAETEKYAHITYFFNGGSHTQNTFEDRILIPSSKECIKVNYKMKALNITNAIIDNQFNYDFIVANFANADMLGHTGDEAATIKAINHIDYCIGLLLDKLEITLCITSDHGNAEKMADEQNNRFTSHTTNPVFFLTNKDIKLKSNGSLTNIASTILDLMGIKQDEFNSSLILPKQQ